MNQNANQIQKGKEWWCVHEVEKSSYLASLYASWASYIKRVHKFRDF